MCQPAYNAENWFHEAVRWYVEQHQGCPWCLGANRVYKSDRNGVIGVVAQGVVGQYSPDVGARHLRRAEGTRQRERG